MLWKRKIQKGKNASSPALSLFLEDEAVPFTDVQNIVVKHSAKLIIQFHRYIKYSWVRRKPFNVAAEDLPEENSSIGKLQKLLIEIQKDTTLYHHFKKQKDSLIAFWVKEHRENPVQRGEALIALLNLTVTHLCGAGFSALTVVKTKLRNRLQRCGPSSTIPRLE